MPCYRASLWSLIKRGGEGNVFYAALYSVCVLMTLLLQSAEKCYSNERRRATWHSRLGLMRWRRSTKPSGHVGGVFGDLWVWMIPLCEKQGREIRQSGHLRGDTVQQKELHSQLIVLLKFSSRFLPGCWGSKSLVSDLRLMPRPKVLFLISSYLYRRRCMCSSPYFVPLSL